MLSENVETSNGDKWKLIITLIELPNMGNNCGILASKHMLTCVLKGSFIFYFWKDSMVVLRIFLRVAIKKLK